VASLATDAARIFRAALQAADPARAVERAFPLNRQELGRFRNIYVLGAGKAGAAMAKPVEKLLGSRITSGLINVKYGHTSPRLRRIELNESGHPIPDAAGERGARRMAEIAESAGDRDLVICLISGGASALLPLPAPPVTLEQTQKLTELLLHSGANIHEMNTVRKHISQVKGGQLARLAYPATVLALILSDVIGDDLDVIGSGPTVPDRSTFADARAVLEKYKIMGRVPAAIRERLDGNAGETPKPGDRVFQKVRNIIAGSNRMAVDAAARQARALKYHTLVLSTFIEGETRDVARVHAAIAKEIRASGRPLKPPACIISGGETTVTIRGKGLGGRNQEFALAAAIDIAGMNDVLLFSAGTDGTDGPTDAAGAFADGQTIAHARKLGLDAAAFLADNDSYHFFEKAGGLVKTGPTGTNVADVRIVLVR
jgi:glycerate 2-kinase